MTNPLNRRTLSGVAAALLLVGFAGGAAGQDGPTSLTLEEAVRLAEQNNPAFLTRRNDQGPADWSVREAYAAFLPTFNTSLGAQYEANGTQRFGIFTGADIGAGTTDYYLSDYSLSLNYSLSGQTFFQAASARADSKAVRAGVTAARFNLTTAVTRQYMTTLRAQDGVLVADRQFERAYQNHELAAARVRVGAAVSTEGKQAEVERGRAEVAVLQARNTLRSERLRLMEQIGLSMDADVVLSSEVAVFDLGQSAEELQQLALEGHPQLRSLAAARAARVADVRQARSSYFPTLTASARWSGFTREIGDQGFLVGQAEDGFAGQRTNCDFLNEVSSGLSSPLTGYPRDCSGIALSDADRAALLAGNKAFPLDFQSQPFSVAVRVSLPVFQGFSRERQAEQAQAAAEDARYALQAEELRLRTAVATALGSLETTRQVAAIEERNREVAGQQLELARERYRMGAAAFLELLDAQSSMAAAERDYLNAVYNFHDALADLEAAVGRPLRPGSGGEQP